MQAVRVRLLLSVLGLAIVVANVHWRWTGPPRANGAPAPANNEAPPIEQAPATPVAEPAVPEKRRPSAQAVEREGVRVEFSLEAIDGAEVAPGRAATAAFTLSDVRTGERVRGQQPLAWMTPRAAPTRPDEAACKAMVKKFVGGALGQTADVNMNAYFVLTMNHDNTLSVIDPQLASNRTKLVSLVSLPGVAADWALHPDLDRIFVTLPASGRVAVVDTGRFKVRGSYAVGKAPTRLSIAPGGRTVAVANDGDGTVSLLDGESAEVTATVRTGAGHQELGFADGGRTLWVAATGAEAVYVIDIASAAVTPIPVGAGATSLAVSETAQAVWVTLPAKGELVAVDLRSRQVVRRLTLERGVDRVAFDPSGRWAFVLNGSAGTATVVDASTGEVRHVVRGLKTPDAIAFTEQTAYVRAAGQGPIVLVRLGSLNQPGDPAVLHVPISERPAADSLGVGVASPISPSPGGASVLVASPADRALYFYQEGLMAPSGTYRNYGREPRAVMVLNRSLRETEPGVYATTVRPSRDGIYDVAVLLESPRVAVCFEQRVGTGDVEAARAPAGLELVPLFDPGARLTAGTKTPLSFRLVDGAKREPVPPEEVRVLLFRPPGAWQERPRPELLPDGSLRVWFTPPESGRYQLMVGLRRGHPSGVVPAIPLAVSPAPAATSEVRP